MSGIHAILLLIAKALLEKVIAQLQKVIADIGQEALSPLRQMVQGEVEKVWRGKGATAFVNELSSIFIPGVGSVSDSLSKLNNDIQFARDRMEQADAQAEQLIRGRLEEKARFF